jgi:TM2 domain-containing membrane protein YozV
VSNDPNDPPAGGPIRADGGVPLPQADPAPRSHDPVVGVHPGAEPTYPVQAHPAQVVPRAPQGQPQHGPLAAHPPQAYAPHGYDPRTGQPLAHPLANPHPAYPPLAYPPGYPAQGHPQGYPPQAYPQVNPQAYPQAYPPPGYPGYGPQGYPQQAYPGQHPMPVYGPVPIHIVVQNTNHLGPVAGAGLVRVSNKNRMAAALLAFVLGAFGAHKFYLGRSVAGVLYLLFFWTLIPSFMALIDFVVLLVMSDHEFDMKYNTALQR